MKTGIAYGAAAGVMAAGAGFTAKIALSGELSRRLALQLDYYCHSDWNMFAIRAGFGLATLLLNSVMLTLTAKAMLFCPTTLQSVVTISAVNFSVTALLGTLIMGEQLGLLGIFGIVFIQLGLFLISQDKEKSN